MQLLGKWDRTYWMYWLGRKVEIYYESKNKLLNMWDEKQLK